MIVVASSPAGDFPTPDPILARACMAGFLDLSLLETQVKVLSFLAWFGNPHRKLADIRPVRRHLRKGSCSAHDILLYCSEVLIKYDIIQYKI